MVEARIYLPDHLKDRWDRFVRLCAREGSSASEKVREWMIAYLDQHEHGNPQTLLDRYKVAGDARIAISRDEDLWPEMPCKLRNTWGRCRVLLEPCSREVCPRLTAAYREHVEDPDMALDPPPKRSF